MMGMDLPKKMGIATIGTSLSLTEVCDGLDNDCNGEIDDNPSDMQIFYRDADGRWFRSRIGFFCPVQVLKDTSKPKFEMV